MTKWSWKELREELEGFLLFLAPPTFLCLVIFIVYVLGLAVLG